MKHILVISAVALLTTSCGGGPSSVPASPAPSVRPPQSIPAPAQTPRPRPSRNEARDQCGAKALQTLVGKPRSAIPVPVDVTRRRVACTTCPVTMDYREDRLNIFFDAETGIIKEVKCG